MGQRPGARYCERAAALPSHALNLLHAANTGVQEAAHEADLSDAKGVLSSLMTHLFHAAFKGVCEAAQSAAPVRR